jgi:hypothetical protein
VNRNNLKWYRGIHGYLDLWYQHYHQTWQSSTDRERTMKTKCLQIVCASTLILSASPMVLGQEALKELENLLRNKQPPVQESNASQLGSGGTASGDAPTSDLKLSPPDAAIPTEELPVPGSSPRKAPLVITPNKKPVPSNPFPNATPPSNAAAQPRAANPGSANSGTEMAAESDDYEAIPGGYLGLTLEPVLGVGKEAFGSGIALLGWQDKPSRRSINSQARSRSLRLARRSSFSSSAGVATPH